MKPRVFVSSTFYDLKYVREDISNFIKSHGYEPIMFEDGDIGYIPGRPLDTSCYDTMHSADMVILIIGGNYGSPSSEYNQEDLSDFTRYTSITRKEFKTALDNGIPIFVFVEENVYSEYEIYELNKSYLQDVTNTFRFSATKNINVFSFISEIKSIGSISITEFKKSSQIKDFLEKQWSDMLKNYLTMVKGKEDNQKTHDSIEELRLAIREMQLLVNGLFEKSFNSQVELEYDSVKKEQRNIRAQSIEKQLHYFIVYEINAHIYLNEYSLHEVLEYMLDSIIVTALKIRKPLNEKSRNTILSDLMHKLDEIGLSVINLRPELFEQDFIMELNYDDILKQDVVDLLAISYRE